jgi:hypothetical protein
MARTKNKCLGEGLFLTVNSNTINEDLLFSYSVYIGCVVLQGCLCSHCGISKSHMVNLIPTCIVSSKKLFQDDSSQF